MRGNVDVVAVFGGESGVGTFFARRRFRRGENVDLVIGLDLTKESKQREVIRYIVENEPLVVILGPPCLGFGRWSHLNRYIHPET